MGAVAGLGNLGRILPGRRIVRVLARVRRASLCSNVDVLCIFAIGDAGAGSARRGGCDQRTVGGGGRSLPRPVCAAVLSGVSGRDVDVAVEPSGDGGGTDFCTAV